MTTRGQLEQAKLLCLRAIGDLDNAAQRLLSLRPDQAGEIHELADKADMAATQLAALALRFELACPPDVP